MPINLPNKNSQPENVGPKKIDQEPTPPLETKNNIINQITHFFKNFGTIPISEKLFFVQYLGIMLKAGISLSTALKTLTRQTTNKKFSRIIGDVSASVEKGVSFTESLKPYEKIFGQLFINMIESGEVSGKLEEVLKKLYIQFKKSHDIVSKVRGALTYPIVILVAMAGIGIFMMVAVVPKITAMFKDFNAELPLPTKILIKFSDSLVTYGPLYLIVSVVLIVVFIRPFAK